MKNWYKRSVDHEKQLILCSKKFDYEKMITLCSVCGKIKSDPSGAAMGKEYLNKEDREDLEKRGIPTSDGICRKCCERLYGSFTDCSKFPDY